MAITAADVKNLREKTGAGMMDCKKALNETDGDFDKALDFLRKQGLAKAAKKGGRIAAEGLIFSATEGNSAVVLELNCETDFVAKNEDFLNWVMTLPKPFWLPSRCRCCESASGGWGHNRRKY